MESAEAEGGRNARRCAWDSMGQLRFWGSPSVCEYLQTRHWRVRCITPPLNLAPTMKVP